MRRFGITGWFYAVDLDDAFDRLAQHFEFLSLDNHTTSSPLNDSEHELLVEPQSEP